MGEIRGVDEHKHVGRRGYDRLDCFADAAHEKGKLGHDGAEADREQIMRRIEARKASCAHARAADTAERYGTLRDERPHQTRAKIIGGALAGHHEDVERPVRSVHGSPRACSFVGIPTTKSPAASAARTISSRSAVTAPRASTAIPTRPAATAASTVRVPIDGISKRRSWV